MRAERSKLFVLGFVCLSALFGQARAATFSWTWSSEDHVLTGSFTTGVTSGLITEADVSSHVYTIEQSGATAYTIDLVNGTLSYFGGPVEPVASYHDFAYVIGQNRFEATNPSVNDANYHVDLTVESSYGFTGLYVESGTNEWVLLKDEDPDFFTLTSGFNSGPLISPVLAVPEPSAYVTMLVGLGLVCSGLRARSKRDASRRVSLD
jgi:hypothetical protein